VPKLALKGCFVGALGTLCCCFGFAGDDRLFPPEYQEQWPAGAEPTQRWPLGECPRLGVKFVVADVSSRNTKRRAGRRGCSAVQSWRAYATSGRVCSAACRVIFSLKPQRPKVLCIVVVPTSTPYISLTH